MELLNLLPETSEKADAVLLQLMKAKHEMGSSVKKDSFNPFHKSNYATLGAHLELSEDVLFNHGLIMLHTVNMINGQNLLVATLHHPESGQWIKSYFPLHNPKGDSQGMGASVTYMRRYSINSLLGLAAEDDDGETACGRGKNEKKEPSKKEAQGEKEDKAVSIEKVDEAQLKSMVALINNLDEDGRKSFLDSMKKNLNVTYLKDVPKSSFERCMTSLNAKIKYINDKNKEKGAA